MKIPSLWKIQKDFIAIKVAVFCYYGPKYTLVSYLVVFLASFGLDAQQAGIVAGVRSSIQVIGSIIIGLLIDRTQRYKSIMLSAIFVSCVSVMAMPLVAHLVIGLYNENTNVNVTTATSSKDIEFVVSDDCMNALFWVFIICCFLYAFADGLHGMIDGTAMLISRQIGKGRTSFTYQRLWGSFGYGLVPLVAGLALEKWSNEKFSKYMPVFYVFLVFEVILFLSCFKYLSDFSLHTLSRNIKTPEEEQLSGSGKGNSVTKSLWLSLCQKDTVVVLMNSFLNGFAGVIQFGFLYLLMQDDMSNSSKTIMGFSFLASSITEGLVAPFTSSLSRILGSPYSSMALSLFGYGVMFLLFYFTKNAVLVLPINLIGGIMYPAFIYSGPKELYRITHSNCMSIMFTIDRSIYGGVGGGLAGVIGGTLYKAYGGRVMYLIFAVLYLVFTAFTYLYGRLRNKNELVGVVVKNNESAKISNDEKTLLKSVETEL